MTEKEEIQKTDEPGEQTPEQETSVDQPEKATVPAPADAPEEEPQEESSGSADAPPEEETASAEATAEEETESSEASAAEENDVSAMKTEEDTTPSGEKATEAEEAPADEADESVADSEEAAPASGRKKRWYVIHTYSGHENKVKANMERAIQYAQMQDRFGEILVATEDYAVMKAGKKQITKRKTFPSYVLVEMDMSDDARALVQNVPGVTHFVGDRRPTPLTEAEVRRIRGEEVREVGKVTTEVPFKVGESVKVTQGPFADFVGTVDEINLERGKLRVMVSIFGRPTAVELDLTHVTSI